jgi:thioredoxin reductase
MKKRFVLLIFCLNVFIIKSSENSVIIIGGGPTACSAATYLARSHIPVTIINGVKSPSQMIWAETVENYPGMIEANGADLLLELQKQSKLAGAKIINSDVVKANFTKNLKITLTDNSELEADVVLIATGSKPKELNIPGEHEYRGKGVGICATCDGPLCEGKKVLIIGSEYDMLRELPILSKYTDDITIISANSEFKAPKYFTRLFNNKNNKKIKPKILMNTKVQKIIGENEKATGVEVYDSTTRTVETILADYIFITIGRVPNSSIFKKYLKLNSKDNIIVDCDGRTNLENVFAAGDVTDIGKNQIITNAGDGYRAAMAIDTYLQAKNLAKESLTLKETDI